MRWKGTMTDLDFVCLLKMLCGVACLMEVRMCVCMDVCLVYVCLPLCACVCVCVCG